MQKKSYDVTRYPEVNDFHKINVWTDNDQRRRIIETKMLTDRNFKLQTLKVNPLYKPVYDKINELAYKKMTELDNSILWSRSYTKQTFKYTFVYPLLIFSVVIFSGFYYGVKYRLLRNYIERGRKLEIAERMNMNLEDIASYPNSVFQAYQEKQK